jgi:predicted metalloprotease
MRWDDFRQSTNIEDDREASASRGGGLSIPGGGGGLDKRAASSDIGVINARY